MTMEAAAKATKNQGCRQKGFTPERYPYSKYLLEGVVICKKKHTRVENLLSLFFFVVLLHTLSNVFSLKVTGHEQQQVVLESVLRKNCNSPNLRLLCPQSKALTFLSNYKAKIFYAVLKFGTEKIPLFYADLYNRQVLLTLFCLFEKYQNHCVCCSLTFSNVKNLGGIKDVFLALKIYSVCYKKVVLLHFIVSRYVIQLVFFCVIIKTC